MEQLLEEKSVQTMLYLFGHACEELMPHEERLAELQYDQPGHFAYFCKEPYMSLIPSPKQIVLAVSKSWEYAIDSCDERNEPDFKFRVLPIQLQYAGYNLSLIFEDAGKNGVTITLRVDYRTKDCSITVDSGISGSYDDVICVAESIASKRVWEFVPTGTSGNNNEEIPDLFTPREARERLELQPA